MKIRILERKGEEGEVIRVKYFHCVDYNLMFDTSDKTNNNRIAMQDILATINGFKNY
jgi:hypothetical protein